MVQFLIPLVELQLFFSCSPSDLVTSFHINLGSFQSSTEVEIAGLVLALRKLFTLVSWSKSILVSESQAAIQALSCLNRKSSRASILRFYSLWAYLQGQGNQIELWWSPGHQGIWENEMADREARLATPGISSKPWDWFTNPSIIKRTLF